MDFAATGRWRPGACACTLCVLSALGTAALAGTRGEPTRNHAASAAQHRAAELTPWERAERARDAFEATPEDQRTRAEYTRVMDGFRAIYHQTPQDMHAAESINAVAELLTEQGRGQHDPRLLKAAIGQYEFLRTQYPGSSLRVGALLAEAQIEENDLRDSVAARERYELLVTQYPRSSLAEEARAGLASIDAARNSNRATAPEARTLANHAGSPRTKDLASSRAPQGSASSVPRAPDPVAARNSSPSEAAHDPYANLPNGTGQVAQETDPAPPSAAARLVAHRKGPPATVTGIRHWSTPTYTRVAIDLGDEVSTRPPASPTPTASTSTSTAHVSRRSSSAKASPSPTTASSRRIRAAQFSDDITRVVLDVNDVTEYSAFLLPNPYRLIIDIHGSASRRPRNVASSTPLRQARRHRPPARRASSPAAAQRRRPHQHQPARSTPPSVRTVAAHRGRRQRRQSPSHSRHATHRQPRQLSRTPSSRSRRRQRSKRPARHSHPTCAPKSPPTAPARAIAHRLHDLAPHAEDQARQCRTAGDPPRPPAPPPPPPTARPRSSARSASRSAASSSTPATAATTPAPSASDGIQEKDVVLDVALRLGKLLHERLGAEIIYTRSDDTFIPLETRTAIANKAQADLFLSIHANSSPDATARGVETYYLNFTSAARRPRRRRPRERRLATSPSTSSPTWSRRSPSRTRSTSPASSPPTSRQSLYGGLQKGNDGLKNRGVKKAPFVVLIGANMPSILAEISFVTNPTGRRPAPRPRVPPARRREPLQRRRPLRRRPRRYTPGRHAPAARQRPITRSSAATHRRVQAGESPRAHQYGRSGSLPNMGLFAMPQTGNGGRLARLGAGAACSRQAWPWARPRTGHSSAAGAAAPRKDRSLGARSLRTRWAIATAAKGISKPVLQEDGMPAQSHLTDHKPGPQQGLDLAPCSSTTPPVPSPPSPTSARPRCASSRPATVSARMRRPPQPVSSSAKEPRSSRPTELARTRYRRGPSRARTNAAQDQRSQGRLPAASHATCPPKISSRVHPLLRRPGRVQGDGRHLAPLHPRL